MHHALSLSIIRGRGDVVTRFILLLLSADAYAMQLCKQGLAGLFRISPTVGLKNRHARLQQGKVIGVEN
jgi:hypothetical protein